MASEPVSKFYLESVEVNGEKKERVMFVKAVGTCSSINPATDADKKENPQEWSGFVEANPSFAETPKAEDEATV